jgi:peptidoglycan/xylan/chitin deacetylase (PgdA/CDA1 family)
MTHRRHDELTDEELDQDVLDAIAVFEGLNVDASFWRPPWGLITEPTMEVADRYGLTLTGWTKDSHDWRGDGAQQMERALGQLSRGDVMLMHDGIGAGARRSGCEQTLVLLTRLLDRLQVDGLRAASLNETGPAQETLFERSGLVSKAAWR